MFICSNKSHRQTTTAKTQHIKLSSATWTPPKKLGVNPGARKG
jgi:hypothetical protein